MSRDSCSNHSVLLEHGIEKASEFVNVSAIAAKLEPPGLQDACILPRSCHVTRDVRFREPT